MLDYLKLGTPFPDAIKDQLPPTWQKALWPAPLEEPPASSHGEVEEANSSTMMDALVPVSSNANPPNGQASASYMPEVAEVLAPTPMGEPVSVPAGTSGNYEDASMYVLPTGAGSTRRDRFSMPGPPTAESSKRRRLVKASDAPSAAAPVKEEEPWIGENLD